MKPILLIIIFLVVATKLFAQPFSERELYNASKLLSDYCKMLEKYSSGIVQERFGIEELFGSAGNQVYNDLETGNGIIELSTYLNNVALKRPEIQFGLTPSRSEWEYVADNGQNRRLLVITVPREIDSRRVSNVFYNSLKEHPETGETIVKLANIYQIKKPGFTYQRMKGTQVQDVPLPVSTFRDFTEAVAGTQIDMVAIKGGTFSMGSNDGADDEKPVHSVTVSDFYMGRYEVTFAQYDAFFTAMGKSKPIDLVGFGCGNCPVIDVTWADAGTYSQWLSQQTGKAYRLPTEAEWEYACRAGSTTPFNTGNCLSTLQANYDGNYPYTGCSKGEYRQKTLPVRSFSPNAWGLYDMHGNVWEWSSDWYDADYYGSSPRNNPQGPSSGSSRVLRGGGWLDSEWGCRVSCRIDCPGGSGASYGFRLVLAPIQ